MAELPIPHSVKKAWDSWNLRGFILLSLFLHTFLILFAPFRKRTVHKIILLSVWSGYLLADWAANFAVGLISNSQGDTSSPIDNSDLLALWSPFLLVHLGGPDTITAFALEDNELWLRHLLGLVFQVLAAAYVFIQTLPKNSLWLPTMLLFLAGIIKYTERTRALYLASLDKFRDSMSKEPDPGPNYAKLMEELSSKKDAKLPARIEMIPEPDPAVISANIVVKEGKLSDIEVVKHAYDFFKIFKGLIVDLIFSFRERNESRKFFLKRTPKDAFDVIAVELNFIYEVLFTKVVVVHTRKGYLARLIAFLSIVTAFVLFYRERKGGFHRFDVGITYTLLWGAIALDFIAFCMLIFSDWTVASIKNTQDIRAYCFTKFLRFKKVKWLQVFFRRWSGYMSTYNLIQTCIRKRPSRIDRSTNCYVRLLAWTRDLIRNGVDYIGLSDLIEEYRYVSLQKCSSELWEFIFEELRTKAEISDSPTTAQEISAAKGDWVLRNNGQRNLLPWVDEVEYDASLLLWHIATELCLQKDEYPNNKPDNLQQGNGNQGYHQQGNGEQGNSKNYREFSKLLSDYMLYLLVMQPTMMSAVAGIGQIRFRDTCAEAIKFFSTKDLDPANELCSACKKILDVNTKAKPVEVKGDRSKSVLFDACMLAKELQKLKKEQKWEIICKVWVELMSYAASHCRANGHAQQVSKGGELITFVWLLMAHFGLGEQFQIKEGHARAKLIVGN